MKQEIKYKIIIWALIVLVVLNTTAIGTILYNRYLTKSYLYNNTRRGRAVGSVVNKIGFSKEQRQKAFQFRDMHWKYNKLIFDELQNQRQRLVMELAKDVPDTLKLDEIAHDIGNLHYELKKETIKHALEMKSICTPKQKKELFLILNDITNDRGGHFPHGRGMHEGHFRRR